MRSGMTVATSTKVKLKENKMKGLKNKKVSKTDVKMQMKSLKGKPITAKGKGTKNLIKTKTVKKKNKKTKDDAIQLH
ncbi:hypothetical protein HZH66_012765 [Vespula vulgaris]|uniref:Uncharacterized protein n=1 Tax=Vespula vulgaris TaxID=7454 RepID=A0A834MSC3_VESVU|nr:hypothetical protein HZH66_012765 [Vespula vulgaris]